MLEEESHLKTHFDKCFLINPSGVIGVEWGSYLRGQIPGVVGRIQGDVWAPLLYRVVYSKCFFSPSVFLRCDFSLKLEML